MITASQRERESTTSLSSLTREREKERECEAAPYYLYGLNRNINGELALTASAYGSPAE